MRRTRCISGRDVAARRLGVVGFEFAVVIKLSSAHSGDGQQPCRRQGEPDHSRAIETRSVAAAATERTERPGVGKKCARGRVSRPNWCLGQHKIVQNLSSRGVASCAAGTRAPALAAAADDDDDDDCIADCSRRRRRPPTTTTSMHVHCVPWYHGTRVLEYVLEYTCTRDVYTVYSYIHVVHAYVHVYMYV